MGSHCDIQLFADKVYDLKIFATYRLFATMGNTVSQIYICFSSHCQFICNTCQFDTNVT